MTYLVVIPLAAALVYAVVRMKAGASWGPPATALLSAALVLFTILNATCRARGPRTFDRAAANAFDHVVARRLAAALGPRMRRGSTVLVFALGAEPESHTAMVAGLTEGFEPCEVTIAAILPPIPPNQADPNKQRQALDAALAKHPGVGGILIYGDPSADMEDLSPGDTKLPLGILAQRLTPHEALARVLAGTAAAVLVPKPNVNWPAVTRIKDPEKRFDATYFLITADNADEIQASLQ